ncbi:MAG: amidohydrolase family protein [Pseudomonadota bacterium]
MQTLYSGGLLFDGDGRLLENYGVMVEDDRIVKIAPRPEFTGFAGYVVDTSGGTLLPALIDAAVHVSRDGGVTASGGSGEDAATVTLRALQHAQASLVGGVAVIRDVGCPADIGQALATTLAAGAFMGPAVITAGQTLTPTGGHGADLGLHADHVPGVVGGVRSLVARQAQTIVMAASGGVTSTGTDTHTTYYTAEEVHAGVSEAHRLSRPTAVMAHNSEAAKYAVQARAGAVLYGIELDDDVIASMVSEQTYLVPALGAMRALVDATDNAVGEAGLPPAMVDQAKALADGHAGSLKRFYDAGGRVAFGSDSGMPLLAHGDNAQELSHLVASGMTPIDALIAATGHGADMLGLSGRGRVAEGAVADLLVVDGNPADDIAAVADRGNHRLVVSGGAVAARRS